MGSMMKLCVLLSVLTFGAATALGGYTPTYYPGNAVNTGKTWTDCSDGPGQYRVWSLADGSCGTDIALTYTFWDDDADQPYISIDNTRRVVYTRESGDEKHYRFEYDLKGKVWSTSSLSVDPPPFDTGFGVVETKGKVKVSASPTSGASSEDKCWWTGAKCEEGIGGWTGFGPWSITWSQPQPQNWSPSSTKEENASLYGSKDDPGSQCSATIETEASSVANMDEGYSADSHGSGVTLTFITDVKEI